MQKIVADTATIVIVEMYHQFSPSSMKLQMKSRFDCIDVDTSLSQLKVSSEKGVRLKSLVGSPEQYLREVDDILAL